MNSTTENHARGRRTDCRFQLVLDVWTDGRVAPLEALTMAAAILRHHLDVFVNADVDVVEFEDGSLGGSRS